MHRRYGMYCHACRCHVTPAKPRSIWKLLSLYFWIGSLVIAAGFSLALGLNLVLAPVAIAVGMSIGISARKLNDWTCPRCGVEMVEPEKTLDLMPLHRWHRHRPLRPATTQL